MKFEGEWHNKKQLTGRLKNCIKRMMIRLDRTNFTEVFIMLIIFLLIVLITLFFVHQTFEELMNNFIDWTMFSSALIASIITVLAKGIKVWFYNRIEDEAKLELNMAEIKKTYSA